MDEAIAAGRGVMPVTYHQFWLIEAGHHRYPPIRATNGLVGTAPQGRLRPAALGADADPLPELTVAGPGDYRVRVHARGRDTMIDGVASEPVEDYLVVVWPQAWADEEIYRQTDRYGAGMRISAARAPILPEQEPTAEDRRRAQLDAHLRAVRERNGHKAA